MKKFILLLALSLPCYGIETDKAAHLGMSYAIQTFTYGFSKKALGLDRADAIIFSAATTLLFGVGKEALDRASGGKMDIKDIGANVAGQALSIGTVLMFDF